MKVRSCHLPCQNILSAWQCPMSPEMIWGLATPWTSFRPLTTLTPLAESPSLCLLVVLDTPRSFPPRPPHLLSPEAPWKTLSLLWDPPSLSWLHKPPQYRHTSSPLFSSIALSSLSYTSNFLIYFVVHHPLIDYKHYQGRDFDLHCPLRWKSAKHILDT